MTYIICPILNVQCEIHKDILGSDHCPITLDISFPRKLKLVN